MEEKLEYYTIKPTLKQFYGIKVNEDTKFDEETENGNVKQHFENLTLTTEIKTKREIDERNPFEIEEESKMTIKMPVGTILIWDENEGFVISNYEMTTLSDLEEDIKKQKEIYKNSIV